MSIWIQAKGHEWIKCTAWTTEQFKQVHDIKPQIWKHLFFYSCAVSCILFTGSLMVYVDLISIRNLREHLSLHIAPSAPGGFKLQRWSGVRTVIDKSASRPINYTWVNYETSSELFRTYICATKTQKLCACSQTIKLCKGTLRNPAKVRVRLICCDFTSGWLWLTALHWWPYLHPSTAASWVTCHAFSPCKSSLRCEQFR